LSRKQIWTQGQGIDNRHWFPCYDDVNDRLVTETIITFDTNYTVVSNGKLVSKKKNRCGEYIWHYAMSKPHAPYLVMLAIDKYGWKDIRAKNGVVSRQYYYADQPEKFETTYRFSKEMMEWFPDELGVDYPWETYANVPVQDFLYGAMENTTATIYTDFYFQDARQALERSYVATNAHELAHQWFGNLVTEWSATHHWLHESFATYYAKLFMKKVAGQDYYEWNRRSEYEQAIAADERDRYPVAHSAAGSARHYPKGSAVIDMLRHLTGDSIFRRAIRHFLKKHQFGNVDTHDFWRSFMECCGMNLDWFFDQWIWHAGFPQLEISADTSKKNLLMVTVRQTQHPNESGRYFKLPACVDVYLDNGKKISQKKWISKADTFVFAIPEESKIAYILFDEGDHLLKKVNFTKPLHHLLQQARQAKHFIDRYDAVYALRAYNIEQKETFLAELFQQNDYYPILQEILYQLRTRHNEKSLNVFKKALSHPEVLVRRSALQNTDSITTNMLPDYERLLHDSSYVNIELALRKLCALFPDNCKEYLKRTEDISGINNNVAITRLELLAKKERLPYADMLVNYASESYEFRTRLKAMEALEQINYYNNALVEHLIQAVLHPNHRLANPASQTLRHFLKEESFKELYKAKLSLRDFSDQERKILNSFL
ncbi:MAG: M1 family metallopeptidase, partial [Chitinophagales bacterium]|nr:M1 family metallopeptidase [Chitinophagales bacterium]